MAFYLRISELVEGPLTRGEVQSRLERKKLITTQTPAWQIGWPAWQTVAEVLQPQPTSVVPQTGAATPPPPAADDTGPKPPPYHRTLLLAAALFGFDGLIGGQGFLSLLVLYVGMPVLAIRVLLARKDSDLCRRRLASVGIYLAAALAALALVRFDQAGARVRAEQVIAACEKFKQTEGDYPKALVELTPKFLPAIPPAREFGMTTKKFTYLIAGPNEFVKGTNVHVLIYTTIPPIGRAYYVFEEKRWGFYD